MVTVDDLILAGLLLTATQMMWSQAVSVDTALADAQRERERHFVARHSKNWGR